MNTDKILAIQLQKPLVNPKDRLKSFSDNDMASFVRFHEREASRAMSSLSCGSENWEYREAHKTADAHYAAAALIRLRLKGKVENAV